MDAHAFLADAHGGAPRGLDVGGASEGNSQIKFRVVGTAVGTHTYDQASLFSQLGDTVVAATTYVLATVTPAVTRFTNAQIADFLTFNPMALRNLNFTGCNSTVAFSTIEVQPIRWTPMGSNQVDAVYGSNFQTAGDFQTTRIQIPLSEVVDGYTYLRIITNAEATAVTYSVAATFGPRLDRRLEVPAASAAVIRSPGR